MGMEFGQTTEWNAWLDLNWGLLEQKPHRQLKYLVANLNALYKQEPALYTDDFADSGFEWIECNDADNSVVTFIRRDKNSDQFIVTVCNFTPQPLYDYWVGVPQAGYYRELLNTDESQYGGSGTTNHGGQQSHRLGSSPLAPCPRPDAAAPWGRYVQTRSVTVTTGTTRPSDNGVSPVITHPVCLIFLRRKEASWSRQLPRFNCWKPRPKP
jgi:1,4-alpha-glucan branching enzyme